MDTDVESVFPNKNGRAEYSQTSEVTEQYENIINAIATLPNRLQNTNTNHKGLHAKFPTFRGNKYWFIEFEHLRRNHLIPFSSQLTEEAKSKYFQSFLREAAIDFFQSLTISTETTLTDRLDNFRKEFTTDDPKEVPRYEWHQASIIQRWKLSRIFWNV